MIPESFFAFIHNQRVIASQGIAPEMMEKLQKIAREEKGPRFITEEEIQSVQ